MMQKTTECFFFYTSMHKVSINWRTWKLSYSRSRTLDFILFLVTLIVQFSVESNSHRKFINSYFRNKMKLLALITLFVGLFALSETWFASVKKGPLKNTDVVSARVPYRPYRPRVYGKREEVSKILTKWILRQQRSVTFGQHGFGRVKSTNFYRQKIYRYNSWQIVLNKKFSATKKTSFLLLIIKIQVIEHFSIILILHKLYILYKYVEFTLFYCILNKFF